MTIWQVNSVKTSVSWKEAIKISIVRDTKFPLTNRDIPMPRTENVGEKICENCNKADVCKYSEECMKAVKDILDIESRTNVFIQTKISCKKWSAKSIVATR